MKARGLDEIFGTTTLDEKLGSAVGATSIGPQVVEDYLPFLIAVRRIVEGTHEEGDALAMIADLRLHSRWAEYVDRHGGAEAIFEQARST